MMRRFAQRNMPLGRRTGRGEQSGESTARFDVQGNLPLKRAGRRIHCPMKEFEV